MSKIAATKLKAIIIAVIVVAAVTGGSLWYYYTVVLPARKPIKIGGSLPLTGIYSETAKWIERGYRYWADEINKKGGLLGRPVELIIYDDESDVDKARMYLEKAITVDHVDLILGGYPGTACVAQMAVAEKYHMVYISMGGHLWSFEQGYQYCFGGPPLMGQWWAIGFLEFLKSLPPDERPKKAAILVMDNVIGWSCWESVMGKHEVGRRGSGEWVDIGIGLDDLGIEVVLEEAYSLPTTYETILSLVAKAKASGADVLFTLSFFDDGVMTIRACKELDYEPKAIFQGVGTLIPAWVEELGKDGDYVFSGTMLHWKLPYVKDERPDLIEYCRKTWGIDPPLYFLFGYCWMQVLQQAVEGVGRIDHDAMKDWLRTHEIHTIAGTFTFDEKGLPPPYSYCTQVINGSVELIWPPEVRTAEPVYPRPHWEEYGGASATTAGLTVDVESVPPGPGHLCYNIMANHLGAPSFIKGPMMLIMGLTAAVLLVTLAKVL